MTRWAESVGRGTIRVASVLVLTLGILVANIPRLDAVESKPGAPCTPRPYPERIQWWADARFGMLITWGPVSLKGSELSWSRANTNPLCPNRGEIPAKEYDNLYKQFNPTRFNADEWMQAATAAGMKYIVFVAKHCDGFLLWDSSSCDYDITADEVSKLFKMQ